uniref:Arminin 2a n=1 Tax=Hydra vulgaris TaxID=6087 RepID=ARM2A_HYDVU|nr:arminin 2a [Hydra vulgaris]
MKTVFAILFLAFIALTYARSYEDVKEEIKNEVVKEILEDLEEESDELDDKSKEINDAKPYRWLRNKWWRRIRPDIRMAGKK